MTTTTLLSRVPVRFNARTQALQRVSSTVFIGKRFTLRKRNMIFFQCRMLRMLAILSNTTSVRISGVRMIRNNNISLTIRTRYFYRVYSLRHTNSTILPASVHTSSVNDILDGSLHRAPITTTNNLNNDSESVRYTTRLNMFVRLGITRKLFRPLVVRLFRLASRNSNFISNVITRKINRRRMIKTSDITSNLVRFRVGTSQPTQVNFMTKGTFTLMMRDLIRVLLGDTIRITTNVSQRTITTDTSMLVGEGPNFLNASVPRNCVRKTKRRRKGRYLVAISNPRFLRSNLAIVKIASRGGETSTLLWMDFTRDTTTNYRTNNGTLGTNINNRFSNSSVPTRFNATLALFIGRTTTTLSPPNLRLNGSRGGTPLISHIGKVNYLVAKVLLYKGRSLARAHRWGVARAFYLVVVRGRVGMGELRGFN